MGSYDGTDALRVFDEPIGYLGIVREIQIRICLYQSRKLKDFYFVGL